MPYTQIYVHLLPNSPSYSASSSFLLTAFPAYLASSSSKYLTLLRLPLPRTVSRPSSLSSSPSKLHTLAAVTSSRSSWSGWNVTGVGLLNSASLSARLCFFFTLPVVIFLSDTWYGKGRHGPPKPKVKGQPFKVNRDRGSGEGVLARFSVDWRRKTKGSRLNRNGR